MDYDDRLNFYYGIVYIDLVVNKGTRNRDIQRECRQNYYLFCPTPCITMAAFYNGMKYDSLQARYEGHVGNRNPILGIGHVAYDEPQYDVEGRTGPGSVSLNLFL